MPVIITHSLVLPDDELAALARDLENHRSERKESLQGDAKTAICEAVCAFANDLPGEGKPGVVFVGLKDNGESSGLAITDNLLNNLGGIRSDGNILPQPYMHVEKRTIFGQEVAVVVVAPSDAPPVRYNGRIWIRIGSRRGVANQQEERVLNERRRAKVRSFDLEPVPTAALADLDRGLFENEYLPAAVAREVLAANQRTYEERLASTRMIASPGNPMPTILGLMVLCPRPQDFLPGAYIQFLRIDGCELSDNIVDSEAITGNLTQIIRRMDEKAESHIRTAVDFTAASREITRPDYPLPALQQLVRNAVMHRLYEGTNAPVRVTWFADRIEIMSPGGPYGLVNRANFGKPGIADYRNPGVAEAMKTLGFVQKFGAGIATASRALQDNGNPPIKWEIDDMTILATLRCRP